MFASDAALFLADDGLTVTWAPSVGGASFSGLMLFDQPEVEIGGGEVQSREFEVMFEAAAWPGLKRGEVLAIAGKGSFKLRTDPRAGTDAVFASVKLSKV